MTEREWLECVDPNKMLEFVRGKVSHRKFRLFAVGCCRHIWDSLSDERTRRTVEIAERFADGEATETELSQACNLAHRAGWAAYFKDGKQVVGEEATRVVKRLFFPAFMAVPKDRLPNEMRMLRTDPDLLVVSPILCRCVFGDLINPVVLGSSWVTTTVKELATAIYHERAFDRLPILADALEDAGCTSREMLDHCRHPGDHVRGCWVVDLLLKKE